MEFPSLESGWNKVAEQGARTEAGTTWERSLGQSICISHAGDCPHEDPSVVGLDHGLWCCATHDCCYRCLEKQKCGTKYLNYNFAYRKGQIVCDSVHTFGNPWTCWGWTPTSGTRTGFLYPTQRAQLTPPRTPTPPLNAALMDPLIQPFNSLMLREACRQ
ncbi:uncharacterized protein LOC132231588 isoform X2 [Myotis daubentonii]|uniref:uncharacterized protein LOC132231588 isoform X2 n=1 Tax=Myotis daubentonii TaxID=98922 RepID=UPI002873430D|nr:uncharacterized protein LOC132231588 isoform X2 [Myotis daubentonii]